MAVANSPSISGARFSEEITIGESKTWNTFLIQPLRSKTYNIIAILEILRKYIFERTKKTNFTEGLQSRELQRIILTPHSVTISKYREDDIPLFQMNDIVYVHARTAYKVYYTKKPTDKIEKIADKDVTDPERPDPYNKSQISNLEFVMKPSESESGSFWHKMRTNSFSRIEGVESKMPELAQGESSMPETPQPGNQIPEMASPQVEGAPSSQQAEPQTSQQDEPQTPESDPGSPDDSPISGTPNEMQTPLSGQSSASSLPSATWSDVGDKPYQKYIAGAVGQSFQRARSSSLSSSDLFVPPSPKTPTSPSTRSKIPQLLKTPSNSQQTPNSLLAQPGEIHSNSKQPLPPLIENPEEEKIEPRTKPPKVSPSKAHDSKQTSSQSQRKPRKVPSAIDTSKKIKIQPKKKAHKKKKTRKKGDPNRLNELSAPKKQHAPAQNPPVPARQWSGRLREFHTAPVRADQRQPNTAFLPSTRSKSHGGKVRMTQAAERLLAANKRRQQTFERSQNH